MTTRFPWQIFTRVVLIQAVLVLVAIGGSSFTARHFFKRQFISQAQSQATDTLQTIKHELEAPGEVASSWCGRRAEGTSYRLQVVRADGSVLCDSRPQHGSQEAGAEMAIPGKGLVLKGSVPLSKLSSSLSVLDTSILLFMLVVAVGLGVFAVWSGRMLVFPIGRLLVKTRSVLERPANGEAVSASDQDLLRDESYGEWSELESSIEDIRRDLFAKAESLSVEREELATLMGAISDAILAVDTEGKPLFFNSRFALLYGNQDALRDRSVRLWEMFRVPEILEAFKKALASGHTREVKAVSLEREGESKRFYSVAVSPLRKQSGDIYGAVGVFHDVTELKGAEQIRIDFVANVSHELRTPLTSIKGYTDTLLQDLKEGKPADKGFLDVIARNVDRLMNLVSDLLDLSSLESTDVLHKAPIDTAEATARAIKQLHDGFAAKQQRVVERVDATVVLADSRRLDQVLTNLLENAHKYTPAGGEIRVSWESDRDGVVLKVADNGPGIPPEHHSRLFERFYRVDKARSRDQGGTGLGLAIVKHILQRHDGAVWVESRAGQGSTFACRFPT